MHNMQSGILRRTFDIGPRPATATAHPAAAESKKKEDRCVTGLATDALDRVVVASTLDGTLNVSSHFF